jgi:hypothetical protein
METNYNEMDKGDFEALMLELFPIIYQDLGGDPRHTCMSWGFDCPPTWNNILYELSVAIQAQLKFLPPDIASEFRAEQVKEKYGTLRFYHSCIQGSDELCTTVETEIERLVVVAEDATETTCSDCGKQGKLRNDIGWVTTLCDLHYEERKHR